MTRPLDVHVLIDSSGSMRPVAATVVEELNRLVSQIHADNAAATVTITTFDSHGGYGRLAHRTPVGEIHKFTLFDFRPGGGTPLLDAVSDALRAASRGLQQVASRRALSPRVVFVVITDGEENASDRHSWLDVSGKVARRRAAGWELSYLGPGNALEQGERLGFRPEEIHPWETSVEGTRAAFATIAHLTRPRHPGNDAPEVKAAIPQLPDPNRRPARRPRP